MLAIDEWIQNEINEQVNVDQQERYEMVNEEWKRQIMQYIYYV